ncbi:MAG: hypothetical protein FWD31_03035 [Planctomycetaceae bacterium]|nr:hypothetical protein [Planctomycetaceae bacterium]
MNKLKNLIDRAIFLVISVALVILLVFWKGCDMKMGGGVPGNGHPGNMLNHEMPPVPDASKEKPVAPDMQVPSEPSAQANIVKLVLGRKGVSEDQATWHDIDDFSGYVKQLQDKGVKEVHYALLPDSIERYEERWAEELKKANMRSYIQTDGM